MRKKRLVSRVIHGPNGPHHTQVSVIDLALEHAHSSQLGEIPTIIEVNAALRAGSGGSWFGQTWEACSLTGDEYADFARRMKRREISFRRERRKLEEKR